MICKKIVGVDAGEFIKCGGQLKEIQDTGPNGRVGVDMVCEKCRQITSLEPLIVSDPFAEIEKEEPIL